MKNFKQKAISVFMTLVMIVGIVGMNISSVFADESNKSIKVNIAVVGMYNEILFKPQQITLNCDGKEPTAEDVLRATTTSGLKLEIGSNGWVSAIQDQKNGTDDGVYNSQSGWMYKVGFMMPNDVPRTKTIKDGEYVFFYYAKSAYDLLPSYDSYQNDFVNVTVKSAQKDNSFSEKVTVLKNNSINAAIMEALKSHGEDFDKASLPIGTLMAKNGQYWSYILNGDKNTYNSKDVQLEEGNTITIFKDSGEGPKDIGETNVQSIALDKSEAKISEGETLQLSATITPSGAANKNIVWASNKEEIVKVDKDGKLTALKEGTATITATSEDGGKTASCNITVEKKQAVKVNLNVAGYKGVILDEKDIEVKDGEKVVDILTRTLDSKGIKYENRSGYIAMIADQGERDRGTYSGWKYSVNGSFPNVGMGAYTAKQGDKINLIFVEEFMDETPFRDIEKFDLNKTELSLKVNGEEKLTTNTTPKEATEKILWSSSDENIAKVDKDGKVTGLKEGTATITGTTKYTKQTAVCKITVAGSKPEEPTQPKDYTNSINALIDGISPKISIDEWTALDLNKAGKEVPKDYLTKLEETVKGNKGVFPGATDYEKAVLGILGAGGNPTNFAGYNLVEKIYNNEKLSGINAYIFGLIALDSANFKVPEDAKWTREKFVQSILNSKISDGGWAFSGKNADPDITAMALSALAPYYNTNTEVKAAVDAAIEKLSKIQTDKGGFASWGSYNSNSAAMVIIGLCDNGVDPVKDGRFVKNGNNLMDALLSFAVSDNSGFGYIDNSKTNSMSTEQGLRAIAAYKLFKDGKGSVYKGFKVDNNGNKPEEPPIQPKDYTNSINVLIDGISPKIPIDEWSVLELNKVGKEVPKDYLAKLESTVKGNNGVFRQATDCEKTVLAILGAGGNPTNFAGYNLVEKIYNSEDMRSQGLNAYVFGLIALDSANFKVPENAKWTREKLIQSILNSKTNDGGWSYDGVTADPDMTAMALSALAPYYNTNTEAKAAIDAAIERLSKIQTDKGGFASYNKENSNSTAMVIIGLCDNGIDIAADKRFVKNGKNPIDALLSFAVTDNSGFGYTDNTIADPMATEQGLRAIAAYKLFKDGKGSVYKGFKVDGNENKTIEIENLTKDTVFNLGSDAKISIKATNKGEKDQDTSLIIGLFDKDGQFVNYISGKQTIKKGDSSVLTNMMKLPKEGQYKLKAFVWDDIESMNPFTDAIEIPVK